MGALHLPLLGEPTINKPVIILSVIVFVAAVVGWAWYWESDRLKAEQIAAEAKQIAAVENWVREDLRRNLKNPHSAVFKNVQRKSSSLACGFVNSKNSHGDYIGFKRFVVIGHSTVVFANDPQMTVMFARNWYECAGADDVYGDDPRVQIRR